MKKWLTIKAEANSKSVEINIDGAIGGGGGWFEPEGVRQVDIKNELKEIAAIKGDTIRININSLGGDINDGISIHDLLADNPAKKIVYINGMTASAATVIAMAGDEINMSENALFLVHRGSTFGGGNANDFKMLLGDLEKIDGLMSSLYAKKTGKTPEEILAKMNVNNGNGEWLTAEEAKEFGFITNIYSPTKIAATADRSVFAKLRIPYPEDKINQNPTIQMKRTIKEAVKELFAAAGIKFNEEAAIKNGLDIATDKGTLHIETDATEVKVGDTATLDGAPAPAGEYMTTEGNNVITIGDAGIILEIATKEEEQEEEPMQALKAEIKKLKTELAASKSQVEKLTAQITEDESISAAVLENVKTLTNQYSILAKSIESSGFEMPKEVTIFTKKQTEKTAGTEAAERRKNYKK